VIVYYNVRKMCEKKSFRNKRYTFVAKTFFETSTYFRLSISYLHGKSSWIKKKHFSSESWILGLKGVSRNLSLTINEHIDCIALL
jgi:hypothetical protein